MGTSLLPEERQGMRDTGRLRENLGVEVQYSENGEARKKGNLVFQEESNVFLFKSKNESKQLKFLQFFHHIKKYQEGDEFFILMRIRRVLHIPDIIHLIFDNQEDQDYVHSFLQKLDTDIR